MLSESIVTLSAFSRKVMRVETAKQMAETAIALKRFQLKHGKFPKKLSALTPEFLASIPFDPVDGRPLRYRLNSDGTFLLYSVGENGVDDGGLPCDAASGSSSLYWLYPKARDWVWPQPASKVEVQAYFKK